jgi:hypothetical protein
LLGRRLTAAIRALSASRLRQWSDRRRRRTSLEEAVAIVLVRFGSTAAAPVRLPIDDRTV